MANPRMTVEFDELRVTRLTATAGSGLEFDRDEPYGTEYRHAPVKFSANKTIVLCASGDKPFGSLERLEADGSAVVAYEGSVTYKGAATAGLGVMADTGNVVRAAADGDAGATPPVFPENGTGTVGTSEGGKVIVFQ